jgi:hypothetical protein
VLIEEEHVRAPSGEMFLIAFQWWDKTTNSLRGMLCNNSGPAACDFNTYSNSSLNWDGKQLTIDLQFPRDDKKMTWHEVWSGVTAFLHSNCRYGRGGWTAEEGRQNSRD